MEVGKVKFLDPKQYPFLVDNFDAAKQAISYPADAREWTTKEADRKQKKVRYSDAPKQSSLLSRRRRNCLDKSCFGIC